MRELFGSTIAALVLIAPAAQPQLTDAQIKDAIALGRSCREIPLLMKVGSQRGDFDVFIEGPIARIAIQAAAAAQIRRPFDASMVTRQMAAPTFRIWTQYTTRGRRTVSVNRIVLQAVRATGGNEVIQPV